MPELLNADPIPRALVVDVCERLGYDAADVLSIHLNANTVTVHTIPDKWHHHRISPAEENEETLAKLATRLGEARKQVEVERQRANDNAEKLREQTADLRRTEAEVKAEALREAADAKYLHRNFGPGWTENDVRYVLGDGAREFLHDSAEAREKGEDR